MSFASLHDDSNQILYNLHAVPDGSSASSLAQPTAENILYGGIARRCAELFAHNVADPTMSPTWSTFTDFNLSTGANSLDTAFGNFLISFFGMFMNGFRI